MRETASPASSVVSKSGEQRAHACATRRTRTRDSHGDPERSLRADEHAEQVRALVVARERDELAVGQDDVGGKHVVDREAVLQAVRAARVLGDVAADRADLLARRIGRVVEAVGGDRLRDSSRFVTPGSTTDARVLEVDLEHAVQPRQRDHDAVGNRQRAARETGARAARDKRHAVAVAERDDRLDVVRRARQHDELRDRAVPGERVALVGAQLLGLGDHGVTG